MATFKVRDKETGEIFTIREKEQPQTQPQETIPQMLLGNLKEAGQETYESAKSIANNMTLGVANQLYKGITGQEWVDMSKVKDPLATQVIGYSAPLGAIGKGISSLGLALTTPQKIIQAATIGATMGFAIPPEGNFGDIKARNKQAIIGALLSVAGERMTAGLQKFENTLEKAKNAKIALDKVRTTLGKAKSLAIQDVADQPTKLNIEIKSQKLANALKNPVYEIQFDKNGNPIQTIGNLDKVKEATGDLISSPKIWEEAPRVEQRHIKMFYGKVSQAMREAARVAGKPIDSVLNNYHNFMKNYAKVNKTLSDTSGVVMANKLKHAFKMGAEPAYREAWREVSKLSPEIKSVMGSMNRRELLKNLLKLTGIGTGLGLTGKGIQILKGD